MIGLVALLLAIPAEARLSLHAGEHRIEKIDPVDAVEAEGPLHAELLPSGNELLLEPKEKGVGHVFLFTHRRVHVIEVYIDTPAPKDPEKPRCIAITDAACYAQFRAAPQPRMVFEIEGLKAEAKAAQDELVKAGLDKVEVAISPYGVKLKNTKDSAEKRKALRAIWPAILGPLRLDE